MLDENRCKPCNEITDPPQWAVMCTRSVENARSINVIFVNKFSATHFRVVSAGTNFGDHQGYGTDCFTPSVLDEIQQTHASDFLRKHDPRQRNVHEPRI